MYQSSISIIQECVGEELARGSVIDVYRLASAVHADCPDLALRDVVKAIEWVVAKANGEAVWNRRAA